MAARLLGTTSAVDRSNLAKVSVLVENPAGDKMTLSVIAESKMFWTTSSWNGMKMSSSLEDMTMSSLERASAICMSRLSPAEC